jgi:peptide/nickel transport system substrate-binding protein
MRHLMYLVITVLAVSGLLLACAPPATPAPAPTKPAVAATGAPAAAPATAAPAAATAVAKPTTPPTPAVSIKRGGTVRGGQTGAYLTLDPHLSTARSAWAVGATFDCLVELSLADKAKQQWAVKPALAESWKQVDPTTVEFKVRPGVKFHDGTDLTADDVKFSLERLVTHPKSYGKDFISAQGSVEKVDAQTVRAKLKTPSGSYIPSLSCWAYTMGMISQAAVTKLGDEEFGKKPVGTGPFMPTEYMPDDHVTLKKSPVAYWEKGADGQPLPYIDGMLVRVINDTAVLQVELKSANVEIIGTVDPKDIAGVKSNPALGFETSNGQATYQFTHGFNTQTGPFATNLKLRQAAQYALDRENLNKTFTFGAGSPAYYPFWAPGMLGYDEALPKYQFDQAKAKQLVIDAGFPNGVDVTLSMIARDPDRRIAEVVKQMWDSVGIRTQLDLLERLAYNAKMNSNNFGAGGWTTGTRLDPDLQKFYVYTKASANWSNWYNKDMDKCMDDAGTEMDTAKRAENYKRCQKIIYDEAFVGSGYVMQDAVAYQKFLTGLSWEYATVNFHRVWMNK